MNVFSPQHMRRIGKGALFILAFIFASYLAHHYRSAIGLFLGAGGVSSVGLFIFLTAVFVVFVIPLDIVFLIPIGVNLWGPIPTALMSILGWTLGASTAFAIARVWGAPLVSRIVGEKNVAKLHESMPRGNLFWSVVFLRMLIPVDILSYALGLFSQMQWRQYVLATVLGVAPFGFYFAYVGTLPWWYQLAALLGAFGTVTLLLTWYRAKKR